MVSIWLYKVFRVHEFVWTGQESAFLPFYSYFLYIRFGFFRLLLKFVNWKVRKSLYLSISISLDLEESNSTLNRIELFDKWCADEHYDGKLFVIKASDEVFKIKILVYKNLHFLLHYKIERGAIGWGRWYISLRKDMKFDKDAIGYDLSSNTFCST